MSVTPPLMTSGPATPSRSATIGFSNRLMHLRLVDVLAPGGCGVVLSRVRAVAVGGGNVTGCDVADHLELRIAVDVAQHVIHAGADERQSVGNDAARLGGPAGQHVAVVVQCVHAAAAAEHVGEDVGEDVAEAARGAAARVSAGRPGCRRTPAVGADDVGPAVAGDVPERRRVDDLGAAERSGRRASREAGHRIAAAVPRVDVLVERRR